MMYGAKCDMDYLKRSKSICKKLPFNFHTKRFLLPYVITFVETHYGQLEGLLDHFTLVMNKKDKLLSRLQATAIEKSLNIEAQYHE